MCYANCEMHVWSLLNSGFVNANDNIVNIIVLAAFGAVD